MTPEQQATLAELRELNVKRDAGDWDYCQTQLTTKGLIYSDSPEGSALVDAYSSNNANFIAAAPRMMALIEALVGEVEQKTSRITYFEKLCRRFFSAYALRNDDGFGDLMD